MNETVRRRGPDHELAVRYGRAAHKAWTQACAEFPSATLDDVRLRCAEILAVGTEPTLFSPDYGTMKYGTVEAFNDGYRGVACKLTSQKAAKLATAETKRQAAEANQPNAPGQREIVYKAIAATKGGLTDEEICTCTGFSGDTVRPRRGELGRSGAIVAAGTRQTRSGRNAVVWNVLWRVD